MSAICVMGLGYIGLPTATLLALSGHMVTGVDSAVTRLNDLSNGKIPIEEPGLESLFHQAIATGNLAFSDQPVAANAFFIAVPTPCTNSRVCDLSCVITAVHSIIPYLQAGNLVVLESTVPPGTCMDTVKPLLEDAGFTIGQDLYLAHCPERVLPGNILDELVNNNRIIGGCTPECSHAAAPYYRSFVSGSLHLTDSKTAEMVKLIENTFRDVNIALANETARLCHYLGLDVLEVIALANQHPRVNILNPGPGVGGHCLAVDPYFIIEKAPAIARLISTARAINNDMPAYIAGLAEGLVAGNSLARITVLGISYKGNVGDCRESPALEVIAHLRGAGYDISVFDPHVDLPDMDLTAAVQESDLILILSDHAEFKKLDFRLLSQIMRSPVIFDARNLLSHDDLGDSAMILYNLGNINAYTRS